MFKWLGKLIVWRRRGPTGPVVNDYGQYPYKPVIARALSEVIGISQAELCSWVANPEIEIYLNDDLVQGIQWARRRLEAGNYEVKIPSQDKVWTFFIV